MDQVINLTPHEVVVRLKDEEGGDDFISRFPSSGVARVKEDRAPGGLVCIGPEPIPVTRVARSQVEGLPSPEDGTFLIVSSPVAEALLGERTDLLVPDTSRAERDAQGRILSVPGLIRLVRRTDTAGPFMDGDDR